MKKHVSCLLAMAMLAAGASALAAPVAPTATPIFPFPTITPIPSDLESSAPVFSRELSLGPAITEEPTPTPTPVVTDTPAPEVTPAPEADPVSDDFDDIEEIDDLDDLDDFEDVEDFEDITDGEEVPVDPDEGYDEGADFVEVLPDDLEPEVEPTVEPTMEPYDGDYPPMKKGSHGKEVKLLQRRLAEMGYSSDPVDGSYGSRTEGAVSLFQFLNGLPVTGNADPELQELLYSADCPYGIDYPDLDYAAVTADPDGSKGELIRIDGRVLQSFIDGKVVLRLATRGAYEDVVYMTVDRDENTEKLSESDRVIVYAYANGTYTYKNLSGNTVTLPAFSAEFVIKQ